MALQRIFDRYGRQAKERGLIFALSKMEVAEIIKRSCHYCGEPHSNSFFKPNRNPDRSARFYYNGIDRLDNTIGYVIGNVVACCKMCNRAKLELSHDQFLALVKRVYEHRFVGNSPVVTIE